MLHDGQRAQIVGGVRIALRNTRAAASMSSIVAKPVSTRAGSAAVASSSVANTSSPVATLVLRGTVRKVASATRARVPSDPTTTCARMSTGSS